MDTWRSDPARMLSTLAGAFDPSELEGHFVLGRSVALRPQGWNVRSLGGWDLVHAPDLPVVDVLDEGGARLGWILGTPLAIGLGPVRAPLRLPFATSTRSFEQRFDDWLYRFGGQFAAVLVTPRPRVYVDPYSSLPVLFDRELQLASSSPFLLTHDGTVPDGPLHSQLNITRTGLWHILGTTPHARAERLLPNHALHLDTWVTRRHWPARPFATADAAQLTEGIADLLGGTIAAAAAVGPSPSVSVTAGGDTRAMLACARPIVDRLHFFTVSFPDDSGSTDARTAGRIASRFGLDYRRLEWVTPQERDVDLFLYRTGCMVGERRGMLGAPSYAQLDPGAPYVSGVGGVIGVDTHALHLTPSALRRAHVDGRELVARFGWPLLPDFVQRANLWLEELPQLDFLNIHLLFRVEMCYGCWGGPLALAYPDACSTTVYPFGQRGVIEHLMQMPAAERAAGTVRKAVVEARWPELLEIPLNRSTVRIAARRRAKRGGAFAKAGVRRARSTLTAAVHHLHR